MENINNVFSPEVKKALQGVYVYTGDSRGCVPVLPVEETLTPDNFALIAGKFRYTADDFRWYDEDGSDRDFKFDYSDDYLESSCLPDEVFVLLNIVVCTKFAAQHLDDVKAMLSLIEDHELKDELKEEVEKGIVDFAKATDVKGKLEVAQDVFLAECDAFNNIDKDISHEFGDAARVKDISHKFGDAARVIEDVLDELADKCQ